MSKSLEGLKSAFAGESQANRKYQAFAAAAEKEGFSANCKIIPGSITCRSGPCSNPFENHGRN